jgi:hypothetical protein
MVHWLMLAVLMSRAASALVLNEVFDWKLVVVLDWMANYKLAAGLMECF